MNRPVLCVVIAFLINLLFVDEFSSPCISAEPVGVKSDTSAALEYRTWVSADGAKKQEAALLRVEDGLVFVQKKDGSVGKIPITALSPNDQLYIAQQTARRRTQSKQDDLFADADETFQPSDDMLAGEIVPREGETREQFAKRYGEHLSKKGKLDSVNGSLAGLAETLEAKGRELRRKNAKQNPGVLATSLSGVLLKINDQRRSTIDESLSAFITGKANAARTDKLAPVPVGIVSKQVDTLREAAKKSDGDMLKAHSDYLSEFTRRITPDSSQADVEATLAETREEYGKRCEAEILAFTKLTEQASEVLRMAADRTAKDTKTLVGQIATNADELAKDLESHAVMLEEDVRIRNLKPLQDPTEWRAALESESEALTRQYESLRGRIQRERNNFVQNLESRLPADRSPERLEDFSRERLSVFRTTVKEACEIANSARTLAVRRLENRYDALKEEEASGSENFNIRSIAAPAAPAMPGNKPGSVAPGQAASPPQPTASGPQRGATAALPAGDDAAAKELVKRLLGNTSQHYGEYGFKGVKLGQSFNEVNEKTPLKNRPQLTGMRYAYEDSDREELFFFDENERLVCYGRHYQGGFQDFKDQIIELFGRADRDRINDSNQTGAMSPGRVTYTTIDYTFPRVLVRVIFEDAVIPPGGIRQTMHVFVVERAWAEQILLRSATVRLRAINWLQESADLVRQGIFDVERVPKIEGSTPRVLGEQGEDIALIDTKQSEKLDESERRLFGDGDAQSAGLRRITSNGETTSFAFMQFMRCSLTRHNVKLKKEAGLPGSKEHYEDIQRLPILNDFLWNLDREILMTVFPPEGGKYSLMRQPAGFWVHEWFEWTSLGEDGDKWKVRCTKNQIMEVTFQGRKRL